MSYLTPMCSAVPRNMIHIEKHLLGLTAALATPAVTLDDLFP
jgi:hypothetical protein